MTEQTKKILLIDGVAGFPKDAYHLLTAGGFKIEHETCRTQADLARLQKILQQRGNQYDGIIITDATSQMMSLQQQEQVKVPFPILNWLNKTKESVPNIAIYDNFSHEPILNETVRDSLLRDGFLTMDTYGDLPSEKCANAIMEQISKNPRSIRK